MFFCTYIGVLSFIKEMHFLQGLLARELHVKKENNYL